MGEKSVPIYSTGHSLLVVSILVISWKSHRSLIEVSVNSHRTLVGVSLIRDIQLLRLVVVFLEYLCLPPIQNCEWLPLCQYFLYDAKETGPFKLHQQMYMSGVMSS